MSDIFLSYKSEDKAKAQKIAKALEQRGYSVWWDRVIPPGRNFDEVIEENLNASKCVIVLWSKESVKSHWVKTEALEGNRRRILIPILIEDVQPPLAFRMIEAAKLIDWQGTLPNPEFDLLLESIKEKLGKLPEELNFSGKKLYEEGKYYEAIDAWKKVLNVYPENRTAIVGIKNANLRIEEEAVLRDRERKEKEQKEEQDRFRRQKEEEDALKKQKKASKREQERKEQLNNLYDEGIRAAEDKNWDAAISAFEQVVAIEYRYRDAATRLSLASTQKQKNEERRRSKEQDEQEERGRSREETKRNTGKEYERIAREKEVSKAGEQPFYKKPLIVAAMLLLLVLVYWMIAPVPPGDQKTFTNSIGMEFVYLPAGEFDMGSLGDNNEVPVHHVIISNAFYTGKYEVTQKQWGDVMGSSPSYFKGNNLPVESVSWNDVQDFIKKLNEKEGVNKYRLPSEAEWEYAARAGTAMEYSFGSDDSMLGDYAWYSGNSGSKTHVVGQKKPNPWGLYDMHGNVWEWVQDIYQSDYNGAPGDGSAWESGSGSDRVKRGGGWSYDSWSCRSAFRGSYGPGDVYDKLGFRLLKDF